MVIAVRVLKLRGTQAETSIKVQLFSPQQDKSGSWFCDYEIDWPHGPWRSAGWGMDAIQAILLTCQKIGVEIYTSEYHTSGALIWEKAGGGYGFPVPKNARDMLIGDDAIFEE